MSISGLSSASQAVYLQYLTGSSDSKTSIVSELFSAVYGTDASATTDSYLAQASEGTVLTDTGQKAAQAELKASIYGSLFDLTI
jgi:hypothetical protein